MLWVVGALRHYEVNRMLLQLLDSCDKHVHAEQLSQRYKLVCTAPANLHFIVWE